MSSNFDPHLAVGNFTLIKGSASNVAVIDPTTPNPPFVKNFVLNRTEDFDVQVTWELEGFLVPIWLSALDDNNNQWSVKVFAESVGPGPEIQIAETTVAVGPIVNPKSYSVTLTVPANTLPESNPGSAQNSGIYKLTACIFLNSILGEPGYDIVGFAEGTTIKIEDPV